MRRRTRVKVAVRRLTDTIGKDMDSTILELLFCILLTGLAVASLLSNRTPQWLRTETNRSRFAWSSGSWAVICWLGTGSLVFMWPALAVLSAGFAAYCIYAFEGSALRRGVLAFGATIPGSFSYWLLSPPWPHGWASFKPIFVIGPPTIVLVVVMLWMGLQRFFVSKKRHDAHARTS